MEQTVQTDQTPRAARIALAAAIPCGICAVGAAVLLCGLLLRFAAGLPEGFSYILHLLALFAGPILCGACLIFGGVGLYQSRRWYRTSQKGARYSAIALIVGGAALLLTAALAVLLFAGPAA